MIRDGLELVEDLVFKAGSRESISSLSLYLSLISILLILSLPTGVCLQVLVLIHMVHLMFLDLSQIGLLGIWNYSYIVIAYGCALWYS